MTSTSGAPAIAVHGGAFDIAPAERDRHREGCLAAARAGWQVLEDGGSALDAVERAVRELEGSGIFGAGPWLGAERGGLHRARRRDDGRRRPRRRVGRRRSVACRTRSRWPGASSRARSPSSPGPARDSSPSVPASRRATRTTSSRSANGRSGRSGRATPIRTGSSTMFGHDTVGAIALDRAGNLAAGHVDRRDAVQAARSGGGLAVHRGRAVRRQRDGRGCRRPGHGERIIPRRPGEDGRRPDGQRARPAGGSRSGAGRPRRGVNGRGGLITLDRPGRIGIAWNTPAMAFAVRPPGASRRTERVREGAQRRRAGGARSAYERRRETSRKPSRR